MPAKRRLDEVLGFYPRTFLLLLGPSYPFQPVAGFLQSRKFVIADFEMALDHGCQALTKTEVFRLPQAYLPELLHAGINVLNLANDHTLDCGREALAQATRWMLATGIQPVGAGDNQAQAILQNLIARSDPGSRSDLKLIEDILYLQ